MRAWAGWKKHGENREGAMWRMGTPEALIFVAACAVMVALMLLAWSLIGSPSRWAGGRRCFYLMNPHQTAKAAVAKMAVMAIEINNESAANLIQSITVQNFQLAPSPGAPVVSWFFS
jgi:hypothetical protein